MRRWRTFKQPVDVSPQVAWLFAEMARQKVGIFDLADRSGVPANAIMKWRLRHDPRLQNLEACYNVLGHTLANKELKE